MTYAQSGNISFEEFVASIGTYCMFSKDDILQFIFDIYDEDSSSLFKTRSLLVLQPMLISETSSLGTLDDQEFVKMSSGVNNGDPSWIGNFRTAMENFDVNKGCVYPVRTFCTVEKLT